MKQSSVEWYINNLIDILGDEICNKLTIEQTNKIHNLGNKAVEMHKDEMIQSYSNGWHDGQDIIINGIAHVNVGGDAAGQNYYNATYGGNNDNTLRRRANNY